MTVSLPSRERGLKFNIADLITSEDEVAPLAGAWIEIDAVRHQFIFHAVAPLAGAWIEM